MSIILIFNKKIPKTTIYMGEEILTLREPGVSKVRMGSLLSCEFIQPIIEIN